MKDNLKEVEFIRNKYMYDTRGSHTLLARYLREISKRLKEYRAGIERADDAYLYPRFAKDHTWFLHLDPISHLNRTFIS